MDDIFQKYTNAHSRFIHLKGIDLHYRDEGPEDAPAIVLLHGAFSSLHTFEAWTSILKKGYRVIRPTLPGFGLTGPMATDDYSVTNHIDFLHQFLLKLNVDHCHIAGSSLGGWLAWEFALRFPERLLSLTLIGAAGFLDESSVPLPFRMARTPFLNRVIKYAIRKSVMSEFIREVYGNHQLINEALINRYYDLFTRKGNTRAFLLLVNQKFRDHTPLLSQIKLPTLILWGSRDAWVPVRNAYKFNSAIDNSELIIYPEMGHLPMEEAPVQSASDFMKFLKRTIMLKGEAA